MTPPFSIQVGACTLFAAALENAQNKSVRKFGGQLSLHWTQFNPLFSFVTRELTN
jgi:hypothetical protein